MIAKGEVMAHIIRKNFNERFGGFTLEGGVVPSIFLSVSPGHLTRYNPDIFHPISIYVLSFLRNNNTYMWHRGTIKRGIWLCKNLIGLDLNHMLSARICRLYFLNFKKCFSELKNESFFDHCHNSI